MCAEPIPQNRDEIINWIAAQLGDLSRRNRTLEQVVEEIGRSLFFKDRLVSLASFPMLVWVGVASTRRVTPPLDFRSDDFKREVLNQIACEARYEDRLNE